MKSLNSRIKNYCKQYKMKLEEITHFGFIASILVDVKAGMEVDIVNGKLISIPIKKVGKRRVYFDMKVYDNGDISFGKQYKNNHPLLNN